MILNGRLALGAGYCHNGCCIIGVDCVACVLTNVGMDDVMGTCVVDVMVVVGVVMAIGEILVVGNEVVEGWDSIHGCCCNS